MQTNTIRQSDCPVRQAVDQRACLHCLPAVTNQDPQDRLHSFTAGCVAGCLAAVGAAGALLPAVWMERGYAALGGEWIAIGAVGVIVGCCVNSLAERSRRTP